MDTKQVITSRQNPLIKSICALSEKKRRSESGLFRFDGVKLLGEALGSTIAIRYVVCREGASEQIGSLVRSASLASAALSSGRGSSESSSIIISKK